MIYTTINKKVEIGDLVDVYVDVGEPPYTHEVIKVIDLIPEEGLAILADNSSVGIGFCTPVKLADS